MPLIRSIIEYLPEDKPEMSEKERVLLRKDVADGVEYMSGILAVMSGEQLSNRRLKRLEKMQNPPEKKSKKKTELVKD